MSSLWDCEKCGYNHYEKASECKNCGTESNLPDMVNNPPHYKDESGIECIEVTKHMQFCGGNSFKYLYRAGKKGSTVEDLKKAKWYAEQAYDAKEFVSLDIYHLIADIAHHRGLGISDAMMEIANSEWYAVGCRINDEIERLESE